MKKIKILIPVYNDWKSVFKLLENIDLQIIEWDAEVSVLIVNDASTDKRPKIGLTFKKVKSVRVMNMKKNKGQTHQQRIYNKSRYGPSRCCMPNPISSCNIKNNESNKRISEHFPRSFSSRL